MNTLTVVLLIYNHEKTIAKALESILEQQTNFDFDIYILDDFSTDGTIEICKRYKLKYPDKIKLFTNKKNLGVEQNFKQGLLNVRAKYFAFLEGDDYWCNKRKLQKQVDALEKNPECMICGHNTLVKNFVINKESIIIEKSKSNVKTRYSINERFGVHPSSRVYRNIINWTDVPSYMVLDSNIYLLYLTKGELFYIDEIMSVYNRTGTGFWTGKNRKERKLRSLRLDYERDKYFNFTYDFKYYPNSKLLNFFKKTLGIKSGWLWFYHIERLRLRLRYIFT